MNLGGATRRSAETSTFGVTMLAQRGAIGIPDNWTAGIAVMIIIAILTVMAVIAIRLYQSARKRAADTQATLQAAAIPVWIGVLVIVIYSLAAHSGEGTNRVPFQAAFAIAMALAGASFLVGGLTGFLFGIPKSRAVATASAPENANGSTSPLIADIRYGDNTNIEEISDWLTKILIGVGLVELKQIGPAIASFGDRFTILPYGQVFAVSVAIQFALCGFFIGYFSARLFLPGALHRSLEREVTSLRHQDEAIRETLLGPASETGVHVSDSEAAVLSFIARQAQSSHDYVDLATIDDPGAARKLLPALKQKGLVELDPAADPSKPRVRVTGLGAVRAKAHNESQP